ncbi:TPA: glycoside hydrolase family 1 protein, partial [Clostridium botulinum]|nr:glycoside hydrolase family 1 protein [Clostridium botulinum]
LDEDIKLLSSAKPDFIAINYYSTATISENKGDSSDISARTGDQQIMLGEQGVYRPTENTYVSKTKYG